MLTAIGDNVNIAARLETQTKTLGCDLVVSVQTLEAESIDYPAANVEEVEVRGRDNRVQICRFDRDQVPGYDSLSPTDSWHAAKTNRLLSFLSLRK